MIFWISCILWPKSEVTQPSPCLPSWFDCLRIGSWLVYYQSVLTIECWHGSYFFSAELNKARKEEQHCESHFFEIHSFLLMCSINIGGNITLNYCSCFDVWTGWVGDPDPFKVSHVCKCSISVLEACWHSVHS